MDQIDKLINNLNWYDFLRLCKEPEDNTIKFLNLSNQKLENKDIESLKNILKINKTLEALSLSFCYFPKIGIILDAININTKLETLNLYGNHINDDEIKFLMDALKINKSIKILCLGYNLIGDKGLEFISDTLKINKTLTKLFLYHNIFSDKGLEFISDALKINKTLSLLDLDKNNITDNGTDFIKEIIEKNKILTDLYLNCPRISNNAIKSITSIIHKNNSLIELKFSKYIDKEQNRIIEYYIHGNKLNKRFIKDQRSEEKVYIIIFLAKSILIGDVQTEFLDIFDKFYYF